MKTFLALAITSQIGVVSPQLEDRKACNPHEVFDSSLALTGHAIPFRNANDPFSTPGEDPFASANDPF